MRPLRHVLLKIREMPMRYFVVLVYVVTAAIPSIGVADDERLVGEPTVSARGKGAFGLGLGWAYSKGNVFVYDASLGGPAQNQPIFKSIEGDVELRGGSAGIFVGYGDFTFMVDEWRGEGTAHTNEIGITGVFPTGGQSITAVNQGNREYVVRWLARPFSTSWFTPYAVVGKTQTGIDQRPSVGDTVIVQYRYSGPLAGLGAIVPFSRYAGLRVDGRLKFYDGQIRVASTRNPFTTYESDGSGRGKDWVLAAYASYPFTSDEPPSPSIGLQAGYKYSTLVGPPDGTLTRKTFFIMAILSFR